MSWSPTIRSIASRRITVVIIIAAIFYALSLYVRLYHFENRMWFNSDSAKEQLFAWNIAVSGQPLTISMITSGSNIPNLPYYINFLGLVMQITRDPMTTVYSIVCITSLATPLIFLLGAIEGSITAGIIGAFLFLILPGAIGMSNIWGCYLAFIPGLIGLDLIRLSIHRNSLWFRRLGYLSLTIAAVLHYSHIALVGAIILAEAVRTKKWRIVIHDSILSAGIFGLLFAPMLVALYRARALTVPAIKYEEGMCITCTGKLFLLFRDWFTVFFHYPDTRSLFAQFMPAIGIGIAILGVIFFHPVRRWMVFVFTVFLAIAWFFAGKVAFWYLFPLIPIACYLWGDIMAKSIIHPNPITRTIAICVLTGFGLILTDQTRKIYKTEPQFSQRIHLTQAIRNAMISRGIKPNEYLEYGDLYPGNTDPDYKTDTTSFWLIRSWLYGENLTLNDPLHSYDPIPTIEFPKYRLDVTLGCDRNLNPMQNWGLAGYITDSRFCLPQENLLVQMYKKHSKN